MRIKDVAHEAGVSTATVSHVINETKFVTDETRQKVRKAIEKLNFYPNAAARMLASGRSNLIGLLVSDISNPFFPEIIKSVETAAFERGYNIVLFNTDYDAARAADYVRRLIELKVAGVALMTAELDPNLIEELKNKHVRVVFKDLGMVGERMSNIVLDYAGGIREAVGYLASLGHKHIAHVAGSRLIRSGKIRQDAFVAAMREFLPGADDSLIFEGDFRFDGGLAAAAEVLRLAELPTAIVAANDMMALGAMAQFKSAGLKIPRDISIVGFDDIAFAALSDPPLTTINSPRAEIGRQAIEALMKSIENPGNPGAEIQIPMRLIKRSSTAPPRKTKKKK